MSARLPKGSRLCPSAARVLLLRCVCRSGELFICAYRKHHRGLLATEPTTSRSIFCVGSPRSKGM